MRRKKGKGGKERRAKSPIKKIKEDKREEERGKKGKKEQKRKEGREKYMLTCCSTGHQVALRSGCLFVARELHSHLRRYATHATRSTCNTSHHQHQPAVPSASMQLPQHVAATSRNAPWCCTRNTSHATLHIAATPSNTISRSAPATTSRTTCYYYLLFYYLFRFPSPLHITRE